VKKSGHCRLEFDMTLKAIRMMTLGAARMMTLGAAVTLSPVVLLAQSPSSMPQQQPGMQQPGQNPQSTAPGGMNMPSDSSGGMGSSAQGMRDKMFVRKAAAGGLAEVQFGQLAVQKSSNDDVKKFAQKMVDDHTMLNENMKPIADSMGVSAPKKLTKGDQAELDKLNGLSGPDFDKEYLGAMVKDHRQDLKDFREEEASATDPQLRDAVLKGEKMIAQHKQMVDQLASANGVAVAERGRDMQPVQ
jgi:putative membrane protein